MYDVKMKYWRYKNEFFGWKMLFQKLQFYNGVIEKQRIKHFKNKDLLYERPFYDELSIAKISQTFRRYVKI